METKAINTIRCLAADTVQKAKSGHPGAPLGCAPMAFSLFGKTMTFAPSDPKWANRDRFVLSNGHGSTLHYSMLHLTGYDLSMEDLKQFRQMNSKTPGHPENYMTEGIEVTTGPLGQGVCNAVGMSIAREHLAAHFNKEGFEVINNKIYTIVGDGCLQEGVASEACSLAGHLGLGSLTVLYDDNKITIDGSTDISFTEDVQKRFEAYGWHTIKVEDGDNYESIMKALEEADKVTDKPTIISCHTIIGFGSAKEGTHGCHGSPLGDEDIANLKSKFGLDPTKKFHVDEDVYAFFREHAKKGEEARKVWNTMMEEYATRFPELAAEFSRRFSDELPEGIEEVLPKYTPEDKAVATRALSGFVLNAVADVIPELVGGSADLSPSNCTFLKKFESFQKETRAGRNVRFGVREHGMAAICNGMHAYGAMIPYCATFFNFVGYALGAMRMSALSHHQVLYVMTHDSIGLGEDGPTHQPIEMLASLRSMPNMKTFRPADGNEVSGAYLYALKHKTGPTTMALSRQGLPQLEKSSIEITMKGAYVAHKNSEETPKAIVIATGSEVHIAINTAKKMEENVWVVSMPCVELFWEQSAEYRASVLPHGVPVVSFEAAARTGWEGISHAQICMTSFGLSAPAAQLYEHFGFSETNLTEKVKTLIAYFADKQVPVLSDRIF